MTKQYIVVDENDTIVGYKERKSDIDPQQEYYRVSALRLTNTRGEILIAQRSLKKSHSPGKRWPAVAGTVEKDESYEDNMIKEMREELWLVDIPIIAGKKVKRESSRKYFVQWFMATTDKDISEFTIEKPAVEAIKWISIDDLKKDIEKNPDNYLNNMQQYVQDFS